MADDIDMALEREERLNEAKAKFTRYAPPITVAGYCDECGLYHERLADAPDLDYPLKTIKVCAPCREIRDQMDRQRTGRRR